MANPLQSFRAYRQQLSVKSFSSEPDVMKPAETSAATGQGPLTGYEHLARKNSAFGTLVKRLDLIERGPQQFASPGKDSPADQPKLLGNSVDRERLRHIATQSLGEGVSYAESEAVIKLMQTTGVTEDRARTGLSLMLDESILFLTPAGTYHLADTVPF